jgi:hypothetical protein
VVCVLLTFCLFVSQQLHRKRHVGNDVVVVVFCEGDDPFNPEVLTSNYNHVFLLVRPVPDDPSGWPLLLQRLSFMSLFVIEGFIHLFLLLF